ncbi:MAG: YkgJ family cysteine cluster protein [Chitinispirillales bacterium]|jgi:Fe-S-cluster containining protein|nr:YkgJ family cysteine cluster protein [Chitinispirillales bacterium]
MTESEIFYISGEPLTVPDSALRLHKDIVAELRVLLECRTSNPLDIGFRSGFEKVLSIYDAYQKETLIANGKQISCRAGCSCCCAHWVEDVNSFEIQIIVDYIKKYMPRQVGEIIRTCKEDIAAMENLEKIVDEKLAALDTQAEIDSSLLLLSSFYQLERPCPLLTSQGQCSVYSVRPVTCRIYMNLSDPIRCSTSNINYGEVVTCVLDMQEEANELLDELHLKFRRGGGCSALRAGIWEELNGTA